MAIIMDGKKLSEQIRLEIACSVKKIVEVGQTPPALALVVVGNNKSSQSYVALKIKACNAAGIFATKISLPEDVSQSRLLGVLEKLNQNPKTHGVLLQLPLPDHLDELEALMLIDPRKDVDGLHPINIGYLTLGVNKFSPCGPLAIIEILRRYNVCLEGKKALVVGHSNIVGKPIAAMLVNENATVTQSYSLAPDLPKLCSQADILVASIDKPEFIKGSWVKEGCVVIDAGCNMVDSSDEPGNYCLLGDVEFSEASKRASHITPVPGGVGPMTIAMLLANTLKAKCDS